MNKEPSNDGKDYLGECFASQRDSSGYKFASADLDRSYNYLLPALEKILSRHCKPVACRKIFEVGFGNGSLANVLASWGYEITGIDPSVEGVSHAMQSYPNLDLHVGSVYDNLPAQYGRFPIVISIEVVEHLYFPRKFASALYELLEEGGTAIVSTPYHGYWKNLAMSVTGKLDGHFTALWDHGHIKFWSMKTLRYLLDEAGFRKIEFLRVGRIPVLAKSMIAIACK